MKVTFPANGQEKNLKIANWILFNPISFGILKLFLIRYNRVFFKVKYKHLKPAIKVSKQYKNFEIVSVDNKNGDTVKVFL